MNNKKTKLTLLMLFYLDRVFLSDINSPYFNDYVTHDSIDKKTKDVPDSMYEKTIKLQVKQFNTKKGDYILNKRIRKIRKRKQVKSINFLNSTNYLKAEKMNLNHTLIKSLVKENDNLKLFSNSEKEENGLYNFKNEENSFLDKVNRCYRGNYKNKKSLCKNFKLDKWFQKLENIIFFEMLKEEIKKKLYDKKITIDEIINKSKNCKNISKKFFKQEYIEFIGLESFKSFVENIIFDIEILNYHYKIFFIIKTFIEKLSLTCKDSTEELHRIIFDFLFDKYGRVTEENSKNCLTSFSSNLLFANNQTCIILYNIYNYFAEKKKKSHEIVKNEKHYSNFGQKKFNPKERNVLGMEKNKIERKIISNLKKNESHMVFFLEQFYKTYISAVYNFIKIFILHYFSLKMTKKESMDHFFQTRYYSTQTAKTNRILLEILEFLEEN